jgi:hypothetical protein
MFRRIASTFGRRAGVALVAAALLCAATPSKAPRLAKRSGYIVASS